MPTQQTCVGTLHLREHLNIRVRVDKNNCFDADCRKYITHSRCAEWMKFCFVFSGLFTCLYWSLCSSRCDGGAPTRMIILPGESREKKNVPREILMRNELMDFLSLSLAHANAQKLFGPSTSFIGISGTHSTGISLRIVRVVIESVETNCMIM